MTTVRLSVATLGLLAVGMFACGLSIVGSPADGELSPDGSASAGGDGSTADKNASPPSNSNDASTDAETSTPGCNPDACALPSASGFALVLFGAANQSCPASFTASDVIENPVAGAGACACGDCSATIDCNSGSLATSFDNGNGDCNQTGPALDANNGMCRNLMNSRWSENGAVAPPAAVVGTCSAPGLASRPAVTTTAKRVCTPEASACAGLACAPPTGMAACLAHDGDVACPPTAPNKHAVGADFTLQCGACGCTVSATCTGKIESYEQGNCSGTPKTINANVCTNVSRADLSSFKWIGSVAMQSCTKGAPAAPQIALTGTRTICCP